MKKTNLFSSYFKKLAAANIQFNDFSALLCGFKKTIYAQTGNESQKKNLDELCSDFHLKKKLLGVKKDVSGRETADIILGYDESRLQKAVRAYKNVCSPEWGDALDYPECCVKAYLDWRKNRPGEELVKLTYENTPKNELLPFWTNNVFNFFSRIYDDKLRELYGTFLKLNEYTGEREAVISWHPCSYLCRESVKRGEKIYEFMFQRAAPVAEARKKALSRPVLYKGSFDFACLNGKSSVYKKGFKTVYKGLKPPISLLSPAEEKKIAVAEEIFSFDGKISRGLKLPASFILLPFSSGFKATRPPARPKGSSRSW